MPLLESVYLGESAFYAATSFTIHNLPSLQTFEANSVAYRATSFSLTGWYPCMP